MATPRVTLRLIKRKKQSMYQLDYSVNGKRLRPTVGSNKKDAELVRALLANQKHRNYLAGEINRTDQDESSQVGKDRETKALSEMNELQEFENENSTRGSV